MTYLLMSVPFVAVGMVVFALGAVRASRRHDLPQYLRGWAGAAACLLILTAIFDNAMMAAGFFDFGDGHTTGIRLGLIPLEDLLYPAVGSLLLAGALELLDGRGRGERA
ncbi:lycopene cyclase domain-containing protein [Microbacterium karelineae]|uniref:lycopene cyclase domain-containing protein n=1 Tax=Microbacterium karelineae TaxID=2654283 RepID=UPI0018D45A26|nr:lycopene cyclase domain-containing protein [Microbacterium karelineae]